MLMILRGQPTCNTNPTPMHHRPNHHPKEKGRYNLEISKDRSLAETKVEPDSVPQHKCNVLHGVMNRIAEKDHNNVRNSQSAAAIGVQDLRPYIVINGKIEL
jgi:hypothetical protein